MKEQIAVHEANRLGIPVFAMVDTNSNPNYVDFIIPANDDASKSIEVIIETICAAINEGLEERKVEKADADAAAASNEEEDEATDGAPKRERRTRAKRERIHKDDEDAIKARVVSKFANKEDEE
jgi:ribosomal protein S2, bacterial type